MTVMDPVMGIDPRALVPGAMMEQSNRETRIGTLEFEQAPAGWLTQAGKVRRKDWRAYHRTAPGRVCEFCGGGGRLFDKSERGRKCNGCGGSGQIEKRERYTSVTTLLDAITAKGGLVPWAEKITVRDTLEAVRQQLIHPDMDPVAALAAMRQAEMGVDAEKKTSATRGLNLHDLLEQYMRSGSPANPADHPEAHRGYIRALARFLSKYDPEPVLIEHMVACPEHRYAGRLDLVARVSGLLGLWDLKTQENGGIYSSAHAQCAMYRRALQETDDVEVTTSQVVALAADGEFRVMDCRMDDASVDAAARWFRTLSPVESACDALNQAEKDARRERAEVPA